MVNKERELNLARERRERKRGERDGVREREAERECKKGVKIKCDFSLTFITRKKAHYKKNFTRLCTN